MKEAQIPETYEADEKDRDRLLMLLKEKSYIEGTVTLTSGKTSDFYVDCRQTSLDAEGATLIGRIFYGWIGNLPFKPAAVGGMTMGADPLVTATSLTSFLNNDALPAFLIRKEAKGHGTGRQIEGMGALKEGDNVILLEDVVTTGGSTLKAIEACRNAGLTVGAVFCLVDRLEGGRDNIAQTGTPLVTLYTRRDFKA